MSGYLVLGCCKSNIIVQPPQKDSCGQRKENLSQREFKLAE